MSRVCRIAALGVGVLRAPDTFGDVVSTGVGVVYHGVSCEVAGYTLFRCALVFRAVPVLLFAKGCLVGWPGDSFRSCCTCARSL